MGISYCINIRQDLIEKIQELQMGCADLTLKLDQKASMDSLNVPFESFENVIKSLRLAQSIERVAGKKK